MVAETTALVTILKNAGVDPGRIFEGLFISSSILMVVLWVISRKAWPLFKDALSTFVKLQNSVENLEGTVDELRTQVKTLNNTFIEHVHQTGVALSNGEDKFEFQEKFNRKVLERMDDFERALKNLSNKNNS